MWTDSVTTEASFATDLAALLSKYPELPGVVEAFKVALRDNPKLTRMPLDEGSVEGDLSGIYVHLLDYPPLNVAGIQLFRIAYWAPQKHEANPWQRFSLISIVERNPQEAAEKVRE
jgi:hypothetical protein